VNEDARIRALAREVVEATRADIIDNDSERMVAAYEAAADDDPGLVMIELADTIIHAAFMLASAQYHRYMPTPEDEWTALIDILGSREAVAQRQQGQHLEDDQGDDAMP
jgi:hypothetical protein